MLFTKNSYLLKFNYCRNVELIEPQQTALAKLCSYCIYASVELQQNSIVKNDIHKATNNMDIVRIDYKLQTSIWFLLVCFILGHW